MVNHKNRNNSLAGKFLGLAALSAGIVLLSVPAFAQLENALSTTAGKPTAYAAENCNSQEFSGKTGAAVNTALSYANAGAHIDALSKLNSVLSYPDLCPYELSTVYQMIGSSEYELNNYPRTIMAFENAIDTGGLTDQEVSALRINIAQLYIASDEFAKGAQLLEAFERNGGTLKPAHIEMLWQSCVQAEDYDRALPWAKKWYDAASPKARKHYDLMNFLYAQTGQPEKQAEIQSHIEIMNGTELK